MQQKNFFAGAFVLTFVCLWPAHAAGPESSMSNRKQLISSYGHLPLTFEANYGQTDRRVRFLARGRRYALFLTESGAVVSLYQPQGTTALQIKPVGANPGATAIGVNELSDRSNYFVGKDPQHWHTNIPTYAAVKYEAVYPGIDLVYRGNQGQLEYDFRLAPNANPAQIELSFAGAGNVSLNRSGELVIELGGGQLIEHTPVAYQDIGGRRRSVSCRYVLRGSGRVGFKLSAYDTTKPLVIDPTLSYSTYLGGSGFDAGFAVAVDHAGNAYITGTTESPNFPTTAGSFQTSFAGNRDVFVTKLNAAGSSVVYSTYIGGTDFDEGGGIAVDSTGNAFVTGRTYSSDFPTTASAFQPTFGGTDDIFVSKLNAAGSALLYSTYVGGSDSDEGSDIAIDSSGNAYITGLTGSFDFPITANAFQKTPFDGPFDAFVSKLNPAGSALVYSSYLGGSEDDEAFGIAIDSSGNAYVTGLTGSLDFPTTPGAFQTKFGGSEDAFVSKVNASGSALLYSTYIGGSGGDDGFGIAVDTSGNAFVTGFTNSSDFPTTSGAFQTTLAGTGSTFVSKLNSSGSALMYSSYLGGSGFDGGGRGIAVDAAGNGYVTGATSSSNFPISSDAFQTTFGGVEDAFVTEMNAAGSSLIYSTYLGGSGDDGGFYLTLDAAGNVYLAGLTGSSNFPTTIGALQPTPGGNSDAFVSKFSFGMPFSCFTGKLEFNVNTGTFEINATFNVGAGGSINPSTEPVTLAIGSYSVTIPAGSFVRHDDLFQFEGIIKGTRLQMLIRHRNCEDGIGSSNSMKCACNAGSYTLQAQGRGANLKGIANPVTVTLSIGNDTGTTQIRAGLE